jgi:hypothetical protein
MYFTEWDGIVLRYMPTRVHRVSGDCGNGLVKEGIQDTCESNGGALVD